MADHPPKVDCWCNNNERRASATHDIPDLGTGAPHGTAWCGVSHATAGRIGEYLPDNAGPWNPGAVPLFGLRDWVRDLGLELVSVRPLVAD